jgi:hypothetical protein
MTPRGCTSSELIPDQVVAPLTRATTFVAYCYTAQ